MMDFNSQTPKVSTGEKLALLIDQAVEDLRAQDAPRDYLGGSRIGEACPRKLQYEFFNTPKDKPFSGRILRIFQRGHEGEIWMANWLRLAGFDLRTERQDGQQFAFSTAKGQLRGHADGVFVAGPPEFGPYPRLWENKVLGAKGWKNLAREHTKKAYPVYYGQMQLYMAYFELTENPALFTALNADTMEIYAENIIFNAGFAQDLSDKAVNILSACAAGELLPRIANREDWFECKWCDYWERCWHGNI